MGLVIGWLCWWEVRPGTGPLSGSCLVQTVVNGELAGPRITLPPPSDPGNLGSQLVEYKEEMYITSDCGRTWRQVRRQGGAEPTLCSFCDPLPPSGRLGTQLPLADVTSPLAQSTSCSTAIAGPGSAPPGHRERGSKGSEYQKGGWGGGAGLSSQETTWGLQGIG